MTAKALRNEALRTKFKVGDIVHIPRSVWPRLTNKMINLPRVEQVVAEVGDRIIEHGKNRLCRFAIVTGPGKTALMANRVIWEEWMLEKLEVVPPDQVKACQVGACPTGQEVPGQ